MAAKGAQAKIDVTQKILETFPGAFVYNKEIRIPYIEDGTPGQIKVVLTAAKVLVESGEDASLPGEKAVTIKNEVSPEPNEKIPQEPTAEEKERLQTLLNRLGL